MRDARVEDALRVWEIRNSPEAREMSGTSEEISLPEHLAWFSRRYAPGSDHRCFVLDIRGVVAGYCRLDWEGSGFIVSIAVDPAQHGQGLGSRLLAGAVAALATKDPVRALVRSGNPASRRLFEKNGFVRESEDAEYVCLCYRWQSP